MIVRSNGVTLTGQYQTILEPSSERVVTEFINYGSITAYIYIGNSTPSDEDAIEIAPNTSWYSQVPLRSRVSGRGAGKLVTVTAQ